MNNNEFEDLREALGKATLIYAAPDGELNRVPFETMVDGDGKYLVETYRFAYLSSGLRDKQALVMAEDKLPTLIMTPADPPLKPSQVFRIDAKLSDTGTLQGKIARSVQGDDNEVALGLHFDACHCPNGRI